MISFIVLLTFVVCSAVVFGCSGNETGTNANKWPPGSQVVLHTGHANAAIQQHIVYDFNFVANGAPESTVELKTCVVCQITKFVAFDPLFILQHQNRSYDIKQTLAGIAENYRCKYLDMPSDVGWQA